MDALNRLQFHIMQDEIRERWNALQDNVRTIFTRKHKNRIGVLLAEASHDSEGRVWVEVGSEGLRLRVTHLHPANPSVSEALKRKCAERREAQKEGKDNSFLTGKLIYPPEDDKISISSLEDYWFNHWQGPYITADTNQNNYSSSKFRRSHRKSKRSSRCSTCQKKLIRNENEEVNEGQCIDRDENVLAHMPTIKIETRSPAREELDERSDDEISKSSVSEDALSRISANEEQPSLSRVHRVVDNELRTSFTLFADEAVATDVVDAPVILNNNEEFLDPSGNDRFLSPPLSPRQSRSCPCSPKLATRNYSPESISNSPKLRPFGGLSKFSLSSSLLAVHRQASNTFMPEFLRFDSWRGESSPGASKNNSQQSSMRAAGRKPVRHTVSDAAHLNRNDNFKSETLPPDPLGGSLPKSPLHETLSLPPLKLSKMSLTYRGGIIITEENETAVPPPSLETVSEQSSLSIFGHPPIVNINQPPESIVENVSENFDHNFLINSDQNLSEEIVQSVSVNQDRNTSTIPSIQIDIPTEESVKIFDLPDVIPQTQAMITSNPNETPGEMDSVISPKESYNTSYQEGVVNLGFDGSSESSDFTPDISDTTNSKQENVEKHSGKLSSDKEENTEMNNHSSSLSIISKMSDSIAGTDVSFTSVEDSDFTRKKDNDIAISQKETLPVGVGPLESLPVMCSLDPLDPLPINSFRESLQDLSQSPNSGANTFIEKDVMQEAREMVFWWRQKSPGVEESDFCLHETECKVKQKPLLLFLHGIGSSADVWNQQLWYFLSCGYEIVAPDLLGHGLSSAPSDKNFYRFSQMLEYICLVFDLFVPQGRKCIVIGHNYGSALAAALARGRPSSVSLIVLASCGGPSPLVPHSKNENALNSYVTRFLNPFISCGCLSRELLYTPRGKHYPVVSSDETGLSSTPKYVVEYTSQGQVWPEGDLPFHRRITIPSLLLYGMKDNCVSFVEMCEMEKTIPRAFLELIPGAGHELMTDCAEEVCHAIHRFIRRWKHNI
ncbi:UNVERIFIED_CONTAM: hypothetical protein RMT77_006646 [Armadillidium vulgare]